MSASAVLSGPLLTRYSLKNPGSVSDLVKRCERLDGSSTVKCSGGHFLEASARDVLTAHVEHDARGLATALRIGLRDLTTVPAAARYFSSRSFSSPSSSRNRADHHEAATGERQCYEQVL
jgi:hypothetical protein